MSEPRAEPLRGRLDCFDGRYRYRCEEGHQVQSSQPYLDVCTAVLPWYGVDHPKNGAPCGADIDVRVIDYRGEGDTE
jgi:hypothetical protein